MTESGQSMIMFLLVVVVLLGVTGMTIDVGQALVDRRSAQNASDAASLAGADLLLEGGTPEQAEATALVIAQSHGYEADDITINTPPTSGPYAGDSGAVEVIIEDLHASQFVQFLGVDLFNISARSVASIYPASAPYGIITLDKFSCNSLEIAGSVVIEIIGAGTLTNSSCTNYALYTEGTIVVDTDVNHVVGGWSIGGTVSPAPSRAGQIDDPLADVDPPTPPTAPVQSCPTFSGPASVKILQSGVYNCVIDAPGGWSLVFEPGDYHLKGGILIDGSGTATFGEGIYTVGGIGFIATGNLSSSQVAAGGGAVSGTEVMFYIDEGRLQMTGNRDVDLSAPTSGDYKDILFFYNRSLSTTIELSGSAVGDGSGIVYAANAGVDFAGSATTSYQFTVKTFYAHGSTNLVINYTGTSETNVPFMHLVE